MSSKSQSGQLDSSAPLDRLLAHREKFLAFLSSRVGDAAAEDILQTAYLKALEHGSEVRDSESILAWFYRILRNAITDHFRRSTVQSAAFESFAREQAESYEYELQSQACACIKEVLSGLKPQYTEAIEQMDLEGQSPEVFARAHNITVNNASVRLHRARRAAASRLTATCGACAEHKCTDCTCRRKEL